MACEVRSMNKFRSAIFGGDAPAPGGPLVSEKRGHDTDGDNLASVAVPRDAARTADHRDDDRHRLVQKTASVRFQRKTHLVDLINLSGGGAMIGSDIKPRLWDRVDLILGEGGAIECAVRWIRGDRIGLEFAHETRIDCAPEQRDAVLLEVIRRSFPEICLAETSPPLEKESNEADDSRRAAHRHPLIWNGQILWQHDSHNVRLRNISASGALIDTAIDFPSGAELLLDLGEGRQLFANVGWSRTGQAGLVFRNPFDLSKLAGVRPQIAAGPPQPRTHAAIETHASPWAEEWQRSSLEELRSELEGFMKR